MGRSDEEREVFERFRDYYAGAADPVLRQLELRVLGTDYGGNSYTDAVQAEELVRLLQLDDDSILLDVGSGAGWPGLFLARESGCRVVLTDLPIEGLVVAGDRADAEGIRARAVVASGSPLPFAAETFDAVSHSDVLC